MKKNVFIYMLLLILSLSTTFSCSKNNVDDEEGNESGILWDISATADETINGLHLILSWDATSSSFVGTLENTNTSMVPATRVEVHVFDVNNTSKEYGPTPSVDMQPGAIRDISLSLPSGSNFVKFNMHPEFGTGSSGS